LPPAKARPGLELTTSAPWLGDVFETVGSADLMPGLLLS
jgi:hypothetical protein